MKRVLASLSEHCEHAGSAPPSRATVYKFMAGTSVHFYEKDELPPDVQATLYNLSDDAEVPGHQLVFHCFNYGGMGALCFAAGLPWLDLYQAVRKRGWRLKSLGLLRSVMRVRGI